MGNPNPGILEAGPITIRSSIFSLLECMRPAQWVKNGFVFAPLIFAAHLGEPTFLLREFTACMAFILTSSGVYLWNDTLDWRADLSHPQKKTRPIPSGRLSPVTAAIWGSLLMITGLVLAFGLNTPTGWLVTAYIVLTSLYSLRLKQVPILDLMCIALGFVFRVIAGATASQVEASHWLLLCTFLLALVLAIAKRRQEIVTLGEEPSRHRKVLMEYKLAWLDQAGTLLSGSTIVAYALYTVSPETQAKFGTDHLIYTIPFVIYGLLRYLHLVHNSDKTQNPTTAFLKDPHMLICVVAWAFTAAAIIYL